jgi:hypothetical protein
VAAVGVATAAPPVISAVRAGASAVRVASLMGCLVAGAASSAASAALGEGGAGSHLSGRARPPSLSSTSSSDDENSEVAREESPYFSRSRNSSLLCSRRSRRRILFSFLRAGAAPHARALGLGAWVGRTVWRSRSPAVGNERKVRPRRHAASKWRERRQKFHSPADRVEA